MSHGEAEIISPKKLSKDNVETIGYELGLKFETQAAELDLNDIFNKAIEPAVKWALQRWPERFSAADVREAINKHKDAFKEMLQEGIMVYNPDLTITGAKSEEDSQLDVEFSESPQETGLAKIKEPPLFYKTLEGIKHLSSEDKENFWAKWIFRYRTKVPELEGIERKVELLKKEFIQEEYDKVAPELKAMGILPLNQQRPDEDHAKEIEQKFPLKELLTAIKIIKRNLKLTNQASARDLRLQKLAAMEKAMSRRNQRINKLNSILKSAMKGSRHHDTLMGFMDHEDDVSERSLRKEKLENCAMMLELFPEHWHGMGITSPEDLCDYLEEKDRKLDEDFALDGSSGALEVPGKVLNVLRNWATFPPRMRYSYVNDIESLIEAREMGESSEFDEYYPEEDWSVEDLMQLVELSKNKELMLSLMEEEEF